MSLRLRRRLPALVAALILAACTPFMPPAEVVRQRPMLGPDVLIARDGARLPLRIWPAAGQPRAIIIALHGFNDYSTAFAKPAAFFATQGMTTYAYDQRGFGQAPEHGLWPGTAALERDLEDAVATVHRRYPRTPLYLLGESMGSAVILATLGDREKRGAPPLPIAGVVLGAPAVWGGAAMNPFYHVALWLADHFLPGGEVSGRGLGVLASDNIPMLRALGRDPLVIKETRIDSVSGLVDLMGRALADGSSVTVPSLVLVGAWDEIVPEDSVRRLLARMTGPHWLAYYPDGWHMIFRDIDGPMVWRDVVAWISDQRTPLPSGDERSTLPSSSSTAGAPDVAASAGAGG